MFHCDFSSDCWWEYWLFPHEISIRDHIRGRSISTWITHWIEIVMYNVLTRPSSCHTEYSLYLFHSIRYNTAITLLQYTSEKRKVVDQTTLNLFSLPISIQSLIITHHSSLIWLVQLFRNVSFDYVRWSGLLIRMEKRWEMDIEYWFLINELSPLPSRNAAPIRQFLRGYPMLFSKEEWSGLISTSLPSLPHPLPIPSVSFIHSLHSLCKWVWIVQKGPIDDAINQAFLFLLFFFPFFFLSFLYSSPIERSSPSRSVV